MFQSFSWIEFGKVIGLIILGYYIIVGLLLYSSEIKNSFTRRAQATYSIINQSESKLTDTLMGSVKHGSSLEPVLREVRVDAHEVVIIGSNSEEEAIDFVEEHEQGLPSDEQTLTAEARTLINAVSVENKDEAVTLFGALFDRYAHLSNLSSRDRISLLIQDGCRKRGFQFELADIKTWWPPL